MNPSGDNKAERTKPEINAEPIATDKCSASNKASFDEVDIDQVTNKTHGSSTGITKTTRNETNLFNQKSTTDSSGHVKQKTNDSKGTPQNKGTSSMIELYSAPDKDNLTSIKPEQATLESDNSITPSKRSWRYHEHKPYLTEQYSLEEGECTPSVIFEPSPSITDEPSVHAETKKKKRLNYSSFIETSKEDGELSTTFADSSDDEAEVTVIENKDCGGKTNQARIDNTCGTPTVDVCSEEKGVNTKGTDFNKVAGVLNGLITSTPSTENVECHSGENEPVERKSKKRKLSSEEYFESTPKRQHFFDPDIYDNQLLSPIVKIPQDANTQDKMSDLPTPMIESKFQYSLKNICSAPLSNSSKSMGETDKEIKINSERLKISSSSVFAGCETKDTLQSDELDKMITVDELLIADITQLCESLQTSFEENDVSDDEFIKSLHELTKTEEVTSDNDKTINESNMSIINERDIDKSITLMEEALEEEERASRQKAESAISSQTNVSETLSIRNEILKDSQSDNKAEKDVNEVETEKVSGRFKDVVSILSTSELKDTTDGERDRADSIDEEELDDDILCLEMNDEDNDGYVDQTILERSHFSVALDKSISGYNVVSEPVTLEIALDETIKDVEKKPETKSVEATEMERLELAADLDRTISAEDVVSKTVDVEIKEFKDIEKKENLDRNEIKIINSEMKDENNAIDIKKESEDVIEICINVEPQVKKSVPSKAVNESKVQALNKNVEVKSKPCVKVELTVFKPSPVEKETSVSETAFEHVPTEIIDLTEPTIKDTFAGFDFSDFDADIYRKRVEIFAENEACKRWGTLNIGTPNADVNLTVATHFHRNNAEAGKEITTAFLESEHIASTYMCENEMTCKLNKHTSTSHDPAYMTTENILSRLENHKQLLIEMRHESLVTLKKEIERQKNVMKARHMEEMNCLIFQSLQQLEKLKFQTRNSLDIFYIQNEITKINYQLCMEKNGLKENQMNEFMTLCEKGKAELQQIVAQYEEQAVPIDELFHQLTNRLYHNVDLSCKYGPPCNVHLRKGPCRDTNGKHSNVNVRLPAGIAHALSVEEDLYDYHYFWG